MENQKITDKEYIELLEKGNDELQDYEYILRRILLNNSFMLFEENELIIEAHIELDDDEYKALERLLRKKEEL